MKLLTANIVQLLIKKVYQFPVTIDGSPNPNRELLDITTDNQADSILSRTRHEMKNCQILRNACLAKCGKKNAAIREILESIKLESPALNVHLRWIAEP